VQIRPGLRKIFHEEPFRISGVRLYRPLSCHPTKTTMSTDTVKAMKEWAYTLISGYGTILVLRRFHSACSSFPRILGLINRTIKYTDIPRD